MSAVPRGFIGAAVVAGAALCAGSAGLQIAISDSIEGEPTKVQQFVLIATGLVGFAAAFVLAIGLVFALWAFYEDGGEAGS